MKKKALEKRFKKYGWWLDRHRSNHDIWTNGEVSELIPRHPEINGMLSRKMLKITQDRGKGNVWNLKEKSGKAQIVG